MTRPGTSSACSRRTIRCPRNVIARDPSPAFDPSRLREYCYHARGMTHANKLTRRDVLVGAAATAVAVAIPSASAWSGKQESFDIPGDLLLRRYMASCVALADGRIMIIGGFANPWTPTSSPKALSSVVIFHRSNGAWTSAAPMKLARARHASVQVSSGHVVVLGGADSNPTASVEIYDPSRDVWTFGEPLEQPRYDHAVAAQGGTIHIFGGSSTSIMNSVESYRLQLPAIGSALP